MRILHICTNDIEGGAARAAFRLHKGLLETGVDSKMFVRNKRSGYNSVIKYSFPTGLSRLKYSFDKIITGSESREILLNNKSIYDAFSNDRSHFKTGFIEQLPETDIINLHWISGFLDIPDFFSKIDRPIVWTLHDMFPFTGGCHYDNGCGRFRVKCGQCPQLGSGSENDLSNRIWERKLKAFEKIKHKMVVRADSYWLAAEAKNSTLFNGMDIDTIHYGIETDDFIPRDRSACRISLGIPENSNVIVFGAPDIYNPRKGFQQLNKALRELKSILPNIFLLSFGSGLVDMDTGIQTLHLGNISDNRLLSMVYSCGDVFVIPSIQEAFGQTALEAMSCGIPVIGFNTGGIPDIIKHRETGFLVENGNVNELIMTILDFFELGEKSMLKISENCRVRAVTYFNLKKQADSYNIVYKNLI